MQELLRLPCNERCESSCVYLAVNEVLSCTAASPELRAPNSSSRGRLEVG